MASTLSYDAEAYAAIAVEDYQTARKVASIGLWNASEFYCQQAVEKLCKAIVSTGILVDDYEESLGLIETHSIRKLLRRISNDMAEQYDGLAEHLSLAYFSKRYPSRVYGKTEKEEVLWVLKSTGELLRGLCAVYNGCLNGTITHKMRNTNVFNTQVMHF